ncbi:hypothetical protein TrST_g4332 [Triparma strigata]|uniref:Uncharacterized protein n=1 Tax=Triparma strigata TaxID=1606541 RepID=A0A9W7BB93_9STRA|nr:hypothetical protein TrST_g4332 [Triparma strigata]
MTKTKGSNLVKRSPTHSTNTRTLGLYRARGGDENLVAVFERRADDPKSSTGIFEGSELKERGRLGRIPPAAAEEGLVKVQTRVVGLRDGGGDGILQIVGVGSVKGKWREGIGGIWKGTTTRDLRLDIGSRMQVDVKGIQVAICGGKGGTGRNKCRFVRMVMEGEEQGVQEEEEEKDSIRIKGVELFGELFRA